MAWAVLAEYRWSRAPARACLMFCKRRSGFDNEAWSGDATVPGAMAVFGIRLVIALASTAWLSKSGRGVLERRYRAEGINKDVRHGVPEGVCRWLLSRARRSACSAAQVTWIVLLMSLLVHGRRSIGLRTFLRIAVVCARALTPALSPRERERVFGSRRHALSGARKCSA